MIRSHTNITQKYLFANAYLLFCFQHKINAQIVNYEFIKQMFD